MANYKYQGLEVEDGVKRYADSAAIPNAAGNKDWKEYLKYVDDGGLTDPWRTPEEEAEALKQAELDAVDQDFMVAESAPVVVTVDSVDYSFLAGYESSQYIDSARTLADNLNENDVELWDIDGNPHIFSKSEANDIAVAVGLSFRDNYTVMKYAKKTINEGGSI